MLATPSPMIRPPVISGPCPSPPNPTISRPMLTTTAAISMLAIATSTLYPMLWPGMLNPSMATKCMPQTPAAPTDTAASSSQRTREAPCRAPGPRGAPQAEEAAQARHDITQDRRQQPVRKVVDDHHQPQYPPWRGPRALSRLPVLRTEHYMTGHDLVVHSPGVNNRFHSGGPIPPQPAAGSGAAG